MAKSTTGKWVSRVGASGGGKAYSRRRPSNYYGILAIIVVLGIAATVLARYDYQHPAKKVLGPQPRVGTVWYAALHVESCGASLPYLAADPSYTGGFNVLPANVIRVAPVSAADSGTHATVAQFANEYPGLVATSSTLAIPTAKGNPNPATTYHTGDTCKAGTPDAGQKGRVVYAYWTTFGQAKPKITTDPTTIHFTNYLRVTMAFLPQGVTPTAPTQATVTAMVTAGASGTTTTTAPVTTTTGAGTTTTTGAGTTTTTSGSSTTTTTASTTTTSAKG